MFFTWIFAFALMMGGRGFLDTFLMTIVDKASRRAAESFAAKCAPAMASLAMLVSASIGIMLSHAIHTAIFSRKNDIEVSSNDMNK